MWIVQLWCLSFNKLAWLTPQTNSTCRKLRSSAFQWYKGLGVGDKVFLTNYSSLLSPSHSNPIGSTLVNADSLANALTPTPWKCQRAQVEQREQRKRRWPSPNFALCKPRCKPSKACFAKTDTTAQQEKKFLQPMRSKCKAEICTPVLLEYIVPRVCRKWGIPFSLVEARTEIWKFYFGRIIL